MESALDFEAGDFPSGEQYDFLDAETTLFFAEFVAGDDFNDVCRVRLAHPSENDSEDKPGPGRYVIQWRRHVDCCAPWL